MHYICLIAGCILGGFGSEIIGTVFLTLACMVWLTGDVITDWIVHEWSMLNISNLWKPLSIRKGE